MGDTDLLGHSANPMENRKLCLPLFSPMIPIMSQYDCLIFDLDGTLLDSKLDLVNSVNWTLGQLGIPVLSYELIYSFVGNGVSDLIRRSVIADGQDNEPRFEAALALFMDHYMEHCLDTTLLFASVYDIIDHYKNKKKAIYTNKSIGFTEKILTGLGVFDEFAIVLGGDSLPTKKPDPAGVYHIMKKLNTIPEKTIIIGDSATDIKTGQAANIKTCGVTYGFRPQKEIEECQPDFIVNDLTEIKKYIS
jgi:phosphoglycolate phosphatase